MEAHLKRVDVHFEFCQKLGIEFYCFHDRDVSPEGARRTVISAAARVSPPKARHRVRRLLGCSPPPLPSPPLSSSSSSGGALTPVLDHHHTPTRPFP